jgi:hypothetical protein
VNYSIKYRILNEHKVYELYHKDAMKEGYPVYCQSPFYVRQDELGLVDHKSDAGLCPNCHRYGAETWDDVKQCIELLYPPTSRLLIRSRYSMITFGFYSSLSPISECLDWCCRYALSDPFDENFQSLRGCHKHTCRDKTVVSCDCFFRDLIETSLACVGEKTNQAKFKSDDGIEKTGRVAHLRFDKVRIKSGESDEMVDGDVDWDKSWRGPLGRELAFLTGSSTRLLLQPFEATQAPLPGPKPDRW